MSVITGSFLYKNLEKEQDKRLASKTAQKLISIVEEYEIPYSQARPALVKAFSEQEKDDPVYVKMIFDELDSHYS